MIIEIKSISQQNPFNSHYFKETFFTNFIKKITTLFEFFDVTRMK